MTQNPAPQLTPDMHGFTGVWDQCYAGAHAIVGDRSRDVLHHARRNWLDTAAAMAAGVSERSTRAAYRACLVGATGDLHPWDAALVLGTASHALDYDDVCMLATCHPSAPPVAALLALVPQLQVRRPELTWHDILAAYLVGTETTLRLGDWLGFRHYALGFHATSTLGTVGAAATCAHALGLTRAQAHVALSIAASSACGLRANFGTDVKPLHVGFAAAGAVRAVLLAQAGADASDDVWGSAGFFQAFNGAHEMPALPWIPGEPSAMEVPGFEHKRFPSCYMTHRLIAGVLAIRKRQQAHVAERVRIDIEVPRNGTSALKYPNPVNGLQGKFSGQYCAAAAWTDGEVVLASFADQAVLRAELREMLQSVHLHERPEAGERLDSAPVKVVVQGDGWTDAITVDWAPGSLGDPMSRDELIGKWRDCATHGGIDSIESVVAPLLDAPLQTNASTLLLPLRTLFCDAIAADAAAAVS